MRSVGKFLAVVALAGTLGACTRMDRPIRPQYEIGTAHVAIRKPSEPMFDVKQIFEKILGLASIAALHSRIN